MKADIVVFLTHSATGRR